MNQDAKAGGHMSDQTTTAASLEEQVKACYSTWAGSYHADYYQAAEAYPPVHLDLVKGLLRQAGARTVLDAGCGPASMLRELAGQGWDLFGFDLTPEMVAEARRVLAPLGLAPERVWQGSVTERAAYAPPAAAPERGFDAAICVGVLPHIPPAADQTVLANLREAVRPGGLVAVSARNQLFSLFTFNRYSHQFVCAELVGETLLREQAGEEAAGLEAALAGLKGMFRTDVPPLRQGKAGEPGYDQVLSRSHNPLVLRGQMAEAGFVEVEVLFYHYHCLPPMLEPHAPQLFRRASLAREDPRDWRGHFMASAFIVCGRRA
jgi:SAM-dependent methyltransferase